jgi:hypothetical protein
MTRDLLEREDDRDKIAYFLSLGYQSPAKIAELVNAEKSSNFVSKAMVANDIRVLEQELKEKRVENRPENRRTVQKRRRHTPTARL